MFLRQNEKQVVIRASKGVKHIGSLARLTELDLIDHERIMARDKKRQPRLQRQRAKVKLRIIDELGFVPLSKTGPTLLFAPTSYRCERGSTLIPCNMPFEEWTETLGTDCLTGALPDRLTHGVSNYAGVR